MHACILAASRVTLDRSLGRRSLVPMKILDRARTLARNLSTLVSSPIQTAPTRRTTARDVLIYILTTWMTSSGTALPDGRRVLFDEHDREFLRAVHRFVLALGRTPATQPTGTSPQAAVVETPPAAPAPSPAPYA